MGSEAYGMGKQSLQLQRVLSKARTRLAPSGPLGRDNVKKDLNAGFFAGRWALKSGGGKALRCVSSTHKPNHFMERCCAKVLWVRKVIKVGLAKALKMNWIPSSRMGSFQE